MSDACSLAAIAAIKAFRKPDTSVASVVDTGIVYFIVFLHRKIFNFL